MQAADPWWGLEQDLHQQWVEEYDNYGKEIEMKVGQMIESKYLKQSDFENDTVVTVQKIGKANIAQEDQSPEYKWLCKFEEFDKPMVLNTTNIQLLAKVCDSDDTDDWIGKKVIVYVDENVSFAGKLTGGLRIRRAKPKGPVQELADMEDDVPF